MTSRSGWIAMPLTLMLLSGCGSTVVAATKSGAANAELSQPTNSTATRDAVTGNGSLTSSANSSGANATDSELAGGVGLGGQTTTGSASGFSSPALSGSGFGYTAQSIKVGILTSQNAANTASSLGFATGGGPAIDQQAEWQADINYLNEHGGMAGRRIIPYFRDLNLANEISNTQSEETSHCVGFTQDNHVYAVLSLLSLTDTFIACLAQHHVPYISPQQTGDKRYFDHYATTLFAPITMTVDRQYTNEVTALAGQGFFTGWDTTNGQPGTAPIRVGVISNQQHAVEDALVPALAAHGLKLIDDYDITGDDPAQIEAAYSNAILRFRQDNITHVFGADGSFAQDAENEHYRPRYALSSAAGGPEQMRLNAPSAQLNGSMGIGWTPQTDVEAGNIRPTITSRTSLCLTLAKNAGQDTVNRDNASFAELQCDAVFFVADALNQPTSSIGSFAVSAYDLTCRCAYDLTCRSVA
jgi:hypothetical protein